jgi:AcrR family transcriptional regulator
MKDMADFEVAAEPPPPRRSRMGRRRREDGPALSRERLIQTVLRLAEVEGVAAINMRRVATELGVSSRLLYRYITDKAELLDLLAEEISERIPMPPANVAWDEGLLAIARATRAEIRRYPGMPYRIMINSTQNMDSPQLRGIIDRLGAEIHNAGLDDEQARHAYLALSAFTMGHLMITQAYANGAENPARLAFDPADLEASFEDGVNMLVEGIRAVGGRRQD